MAKKIKDIPDDKDIYLAFCTVFKGPNSDVRRQSAIKRLVHHNEKQPEVTQFFGKNNNNAKRGAIYERLQFLLEQRVFKSCLHAKRLFPDLFAESATQNAERAASEAVAATDHAQAIEGALREQKDFDDTSADSDEPCTWTPLEFLLRENSPACPTSRRLIAPDLSVGPSIPALFPIRLPFHTGHRIMVDLQALLEKACFEFAERAMPQTLDIRGWDCPAAVELKCWVKLFQEGEQRLFKGSLANVDVDGDFYKSLRDIRHTAVHRLPVTAAGIEKYLRDGELLATLLVDETTAGQLSAMRCELQQVTAEMQDRKCMLEAKLKRTLERIAADRVELDRQEKEAIHGMIQADKDNQFYLGASLEQKLDFVSQSADAMTASGDSTVAEASRITQQMRDYRKQSPWKTSKRSTFCSPGESRIIEDER